MTLWPVFGFAILTTVFSSSSVSVALVPPVDDDDSENKPVFLVVVGVGIVKPRHVNMPRQKQRDIAIVIENFGIVMLADGTFKRVQ